MERIFTPSSIVVIGVSERPDNLARNIIGNLHSFGYRGDIYGVGRQSGEVEGVPILPSLDQVPDGVDLAVILTPANVVPQLLETCGKKGIQRAVIESGGFGEFSAEGHRLEERLLEIARRWDMRFVGPNCISVINLEAGVCLPFVRIAPQATRPGPVSVVAQSGGVSVTYLDRFSAAGVGVNKVVSIGNKTDLKENDYLRFLLQDPGTGIVCLYLESIDAGRELMELAHSGDKPVIIHKANRGAASQRIAFSHTAALADDDRVVSAAFRQAGIIRAASFRDAVAIAQGLALPPVRGNDLLIISRSGGHAVIGADAAERHGFHLPPLPSDLGQRMQARFRADVIAPTNPLDLGVIFDFEVYAQIVAECLQAVSPSAVLLINTYSVAEAEAAHHLARRVEEIVRETSRPIALCTYAQGDEGMIQQEVGIPVFGEIEEAVRALAAARDYHLWRARRSEHLPHPVGQPPQEAAWLLAKEGVLTADRALAACQAYSIPVAPWQVAATPDEAARAATQMGYPVALKLLSAAVVHKSDAGGVALGLTDAGAVQWEATGMLARVDGPAALMVQRMAPDGVEVILGGKRDATFGPVVMFGLGGVQVETLGDVAFRVAPLTRRDAEEMIAEVRGSRLLEGMRGRPPVDREALIAALLALSRLMVENPQVAEFDINPLILLDHGAAAVDARARIG